MAIDVFLKIAGVEGESHDSKHSKEIDVLSWNWGMAQAGNAHMGGGAGAGKVSVNDISIVKNVDSSTNLLMKAVCKGTHFASATLFVRKAGQGDKSPALEYVKIEMTNVMVTSYSTGGSGSEILSEHVSLTFEKFKYSYIPQDATGKGTPAKELTFNIKTNAEE